MSRADGAMLPYAQFLDNSPNVSRVARYRQGAVLGAIDFS